MYILVTVNLNKWDHFYLHVLGYLTPIMIGIVSVTWIYIFKSKLSPFKNLSSKITSILVAILTVYTLAIIWGIVADIHNKEPFLGAFSIIGIFGMLLFGWVPVLAGAFAGWCGDIITREKP